jgi:hypothetical protein
MPQGSPKKIQIDLLLADLALQLGDPPLRPRQLVLARLTCRRGRHRRCSLARAAQPAQHRRPTLANLVPPRIQKPAPKLQIPRNRGDTLPRRASAACFNAVGYSRCFISSSPREPVPYFPCLTFGVHYTALAVRFCIPAEKARLTLSGLRKAAARRHVRVIGLAGLRQRLDC